MNRIGLSRRALNDLMSLNLVFLDLVRASARRGGRDRARGGSAPPFGLFRELPGRIARLGNAELVTAASCPFALCCFGFHAPGDWRGLLGESVSEPTVAVGWPGDAGRRRQFTAMALGMIRELSAQEPHAATVFFGLSAGLVESFAGTDLAALPQMASQAEQGLRARLADHPWFWPELVAAASAGSPSRQRAIRDLGLQLTLQRALQVDGGKPRGKALCRAL